MNRKFYTINWQRISKTGKNHIKVTDENNWWVLARIDTAEWRCLKKMLRHHPAIVIEEKHPWYDFVDILFSYTDDRNGV